MMNIFPVSDSHLYVFIGEVSVHVFCPFFDMITCFVYWVWEVLYRCWISAFWLYCHLQIPSPIPWVASLFFWLFPLLCRSFWSWWSPKSSFLLLFPLPLETYLERSCCGWFRRGYCLCSTLGFWWIPVSHWGLLSILSLSLCTQNG